jgi:hypothetical protein
MKGSRKRAPLPQALRPAFPRQRMFAVVALCAVTLLAYANSFSSGFVLDNRGLLLQDPRTQEATAENLTRHAHRRPPWLSEVSQSLESAATAQRLDPAVAASYRQLSKAYLAGGRADDAAVSLVEGTLITADLGLRQELMDLYRSGLDTLGCAATAGPYRAAMNPSCGIVHKHMCAAAARALQLYSRIGRADLMEKTKLEVASLGCR